MAQSELHFKSPLTVRETDVSKNGSRVTSQEDGAVVQVRDAGSSNLDSSRGGENVFFQKYIFLGHSTCRWIGWESLRERGIKNDSLACLGGLVD